MAVDWSYYDKKDFQELSDKYLPGIGEGETKASQIVTCINKLIYKWYNDGDVFDNTVYLSGWANDLSSYANWLYKNTTTKCKTILDGVYNCRYDGEYEDLLKELADYLFTKEYLLEQENFPKVDTIYDCDGKFKFIEIYDDDDDDYYDDEEY